MTQIVVWSFSAHYVCHQMSNEKTLFKEGRQLTSWKINPPYLFLSKRQMKGLIKDHINKKWRELHIKHRERATKLGSRKNRAGVFFGKSNYGAFEVSNRFLREVQYTFAGLLL